MATIISQAGRHVVWLGLPDASSTTTFRILTQASPVSYWEYATQDDIYEEIVVKEMQRSRVS